MRSVFFEATKRSLKENKIRTAATLVGVIVSVAMITAVLCMSTTVQGFLESKVKASYGNWSASVKNMSEEMREEATKEKLRFGDAQAVGYAYINSDNPQKPFLFLENLDKELEKISGLVLDEGRMPTSEDEIVLPKHLTTNGGAEYEIGDKVTLALGQRLNDKNEELDQEIAYNPEDETFAKKSERTYKVVGISERLPIEPYMAAGYTAITCESQLVLSSVVTYFSDANYAKVKLLLDKYYPNSDKVSYNDELLSITGDVVDIKSLGAMFFFTVTLLAVIVFGSYMLMYNTFSISVREKRKDFEIFASVGATENQLRRITVYEGIFYTVVSLPLGILFGIGGASIATKIFGEKIASIFSTNTTILPTFTIDANTVFLSLIISLVAVYISITVPAYKAGHTRPIRERKRERKKEKKERKVQWQRSQNLWAKILKKIGGIELLLAERNFKKYSKSYRYTIVSVVMSIVMLVTATAALVYMQAGIAARWGNADGYDISYISDEEKESQKAYNALRNVDGVTDSAYVNSIILNITSAGIPLEYELCILDDETFTSYLRKEGINTEGYFDADKQKAVAVSMLSKYDIKEGKFKGDDEFIENNRPQGVSGSAGGKHITLDIDRYVDEMPNDLLLSFDNPVILMSQSAAKNIITDLAPGTLKGKALFRADNADKTYEAMQSACQSEGLLQNDLTNMQNEREEARSLMSLVKVFSFGFVFLIFIIAIANVFNTVVANIDIRRIEFASLASLGMTPKSLKKMIYLESIMLGSRIFAYALPLSIVGLMFAFGMTNYGKRITGYVFPIGSLIVSFIILAVLVFLIMKYTYHKAKTEEAAQIFKMQNF